ncbi:YdiK family protein [Anaerobacillus sp. MEB173]|uniref:YdiK family protein n=1 Tax=Anaerobacillus sp. MEB173 TaxID=3383345 RepID=UPI003F906BCA
MRTSPTFMGILYLLIGSLFTYLAIQNVRVNGWDIWTFLLIGLATIDFVIASRFLTSKKKKAN